MEIVITTRRQHPVTDRQLFDLYKVSYQQWLDAGIDAPWLHQTFDMFKKMIKHAVVYIAIDADSQELLGMHCLDIRRKRKGVFGFCLAIAPKAKRQGIATRMLQVEKKDVIEHGFDYMVGVTEVPATWSVCWHLRNGYRIYACHSRKPPYSDSYSFRLQLKPITLFDPSTWFWNRPIAPMTAYLMYVASRVYSRLKLNKSRCQMSEV